AAAGPVRQGVVDAAVTIDHHRGGGLGDVDGHVAALVEVVAVAGEGPVGRAAGHVGEAGPQVQGAGVLAAHARLGAAGPVGLGVVDAAVARDVDRGGGLGDAVVDGAAGVLVVAAGVVEGPGVAAVGAGAGVRRAGQGEVAGGQ